MSNVNKEMAKLYMEAVGLVIKLNNKLKQEEVPNAELHIKAADDFLERNTLYQKGVEGLLK
jgi:hypothetical protein